MERETHTHNLEGEKHTLSYTYTIRREAQHLGRHTMRQKHKWRERHTGRHTNRDTVRVTDRNTHTETHTLKGKHTH